MRIQVQLTREVMRCDAGLLQADGGSAGALAEFTGMVRNAEEGRTISALEYEAYEGMAERVMRQILESLGAQHPCEGALVIHRLGVVPVGEAAIYVAVTARHRAEAFAVLTGFMDRLKQDVPIWKRRDITDAKIGPPRNGPDLLHMHQKSAGLTCGARSSGGRR